MSDQWSASEMSFDDWVQEDRERLVAAAAIVRINERIEQNAKNAMVEIRAMLKKARLRNTMLFKNALKEIQQAA